MARTKRRQQKTCEGIAENVIPLGHGRWKGQKRGLAPQKGFCFGILARVKNQFYQDTG